MKRPIHRVKTVNLSISLPVALAARLRGHAERSGDSISRIIREALRPAFEGRHAK